MASIQTPGVPGEVIGGAACARGDASGVSLESTPTQNFRSAVNQTQQSNDRTTRQKAAESGATRRNRDTAVALRAIIFARATHSGLFGPRPGGSMADDAATAGQVRIMRHELEP